VALIQDDVIPVNAGRPVSLRLERLIAHDGHAEAARQQAARGGAAVGGGAGYLEGGEIRGVDVLVDLGGLEGVRMEDLRC
jgi:hypothetical protein